MLSEGGMLYWKRLITLKQEHTRVFWCYRAREKFDFNLRGQTQDNNTTAATKTKHPMTAAIESPVLPTLHHHCLDLL